MIEKKAETRQPIIEPLAQRWSGRAYDSDRPVAQDDLTALLEAARWSPSCMGYQPWRFLIWKRQDDFERWQRAFDCLAEGNRSWAHAAPLLMLVAARTRFDDGRSNPWHAYDSGAALMSLSTEASARGLMVHQMAGFDASRLQRAFNLPADHACLSMVTLGYQLPENRLPPELRERELAPRQRLALSEIAFLGDWKVPWPPAQP